MAEEEDLPFLLGGSKKGKRLENFFPAKRVNVNSGFAIIKTNTKPNLDWFHQTKMKKKIRLEIEAEINDPASFDLLFATIEAETQNLFRTIVGSANLVKQGILMEDQDVSILDTDLIDIKLVEVSDADTNVVW